MDRNSFDDLVFIFQTKMYRLIVLTAFLCTALLGCGPHGRETYPKISYGRDLCSECRMIILDPKFTATFSDVDGEIFKFDDIGCMRVYEDRNHPKVKLMWVRDYESQQWLDGSKAFFVLSESLATPMGHGIAAFGAKDNALNFLKDGEGRIVSWEEMGKHSKMGTQN